MAFKNIKNWFRGYNHIKDIEAAEVPTFPPCDYLHASTYGLPKEKRDQVKLVADSCLPWYNDRQPHSLFGHGIQEGQFPGVSGFLGYPFLSLLRQNGIINLCINTVADEMTRNFIELESREGDYQKEIEELKRVMDDMKFEKLNNEIVRYNELFGGLMVFIDTGASDEELLTPLHISEYSAEIRRFRGFKIIEPINLFPGVYETYDPTSPYYFKPLTWWVLGKRVHHSRLIQIRSSDLPILLKPVYNFFGVPQAQILWDYDESSTCVINFSHENLGRENV